MNKKIDLNCDMGESFGAYKLGMDDEVIKLISSVNIACGFHAGDPNVMDHSVKMAKAYGVNVGAHPGFPDLIGFGRRNMDVNAKDLKNLIIYQIGALEAFCKKHDVKLTHVKPHGNLNNMAGENEEMASAIIDAIYAYNPELPIYVLPNLYPHKMAEAKGLPFITEIYADREYNDDLTVVSRKIPGAVITDEERAAERAVKMVKNNKVTSITGNEIDIEGSTICVHGDTPTALNLIRTMRKALSEENISVEPVL